MPVIIDNNVEVPRLIILRGAPAVGKSTIAAKVTSLNSAKKKSLITVDNFQLYDFRPMSKSREKLAIKNSAVLAKNFLLEGFDVVVEYVFDDAEDHKNFINFILGDNLGRLGTIYFQSFYLDAPIEKIIRRNQSRSSKRGEYMNVALLRKIYGRVTNTKGMVEKEILIDTTKYSAKQCARYILSYNRAYKNNDILEEISLPEKDLLRALEQDE